MINDQVLFKGNILAEVVWRGWPCPQKILMVTDGNLDFGAGGFGLSEFVGIVTAAGHTVATAHRGGVGPATIGGAFTFSNATLNTTLYDQLWLFGWDDNGNALDNNEQLAIAQFMENGGGVFATGDHDTLGQGMGANIPRVRGMREWAMIPGGGTTRLDTLVDPGTDKKYQFFDQSDEIAQRIFPVFYSNGGPQSSASTWRPHPVLRHSSGAVDFLPDHPHESECLAPTPVAGTFAGVTEWPTPTSGGARIAPQVVATSISAGRFLLDVSKPPVVPRCFGAISTYDGDAADVGRIVCDATWHHFVNINLNGTGAPADSIGTARNGLYVGGMPTPEYLKIQTYFLNTVRWLAPEGRRSCYPWLIAAALRFDYEVLEWRLPHPHPCPWDPLIEIGTILEEQLTTYWGRGTLEELVDDILRSTGAAPALARVLRSRPQGDERKEAAFSLLPVQDLRRAVFGSLVNLLARELPYNERELTKTLKKFDEDRAREVMTEAVRGAQQSINEYLGRAFEFTGAAVKALSVDRGEGPPIKRPERPK
jgi:hypothetical protein